MWRNSDGKICECEKMEEPPGLSLLPEKKNPAGISLLHRPCLKSKERVRK